MFEAILAHILRRVARERFTNMLCRARAFHITDARAMRDANNGVTHGVRVSVTCGAREHAAA
eukprot:5229513-Lingulodinium_polyedra.AAC.1